MTEAAATTPAPAPKTKTPFEKHVERARALVPQLVGDGEVDLPEIGARLLLAMVLLEHNAVGNFDEMKGLCMRLKMSAPMVWGAIRRGNTMQLPKMLKLYRRPARSHDEYRNTMQALLPPDPPPRSFAQTDEGRAARTLTDATVEQLKVARQG